MGSRGYVLSLASFTTVLVIMAAGSPAMAQATQPAEAAVIVLADLPADQVDDKGWGEATALDGKSVRTAKSGKDAWLRGLGAGLLGCQLVLAFHGLFDSVTWGMIRPAPLIWMLWGIGVGAMIWRRSQNAVAGED